MEYKQLAKQIVDAIIQGWNEHSRKFTSREEAEKYWTQQVINISLNPPVSGQVSCNSCKFLPPQYDDYCNGCIKYARYEQETLR